MEQFHALGLSERTLRAIAQKGFEEPTEIQALTIPHMLSGRRDIIAQAQTGTGKTATFGLPLIQQTIPTDPGVKAIILAPTRELVIQICEEINSLKGEHQLRVIPIYGGQSIELQLRHLKRGIDIVVGTPGRILDHLRRRSLDLSTIDSFIMDEADEMLNMGFIEDIESIMAASNPEKRVLLFSATIPPRIRELADKYLTSPIHLKTKTKLTANLTDQIYFEVSSHDRFEALSRIVDIESEFYAIVFCRTKNETDEVAAHLLERGYAADALHGDISQHLRERILTKFRKKIITILVATDVAARGIDVSDLTHVINYSLPQNPEAYVHRIGRTGRAGRSGTAITFITPTEFRKLGFLKRMTNTDIRKEEVPTVPEIIRVQREKISDEIAVLAEGKKIETFRKWGEELLETYDPVTLVASLMLDAYGSRLDTGVYNELTPIRRGRYEGYERGGRNSGSGGGNSRGNTGGSSRHGSQQYRGERPSYGKDSFPKRSSESSPRRKSDDRSPARYVEEEGVTRLFIAKGKNDGFNKKKLLEMIGRATNSNGEAIGSIQVYDNYSFVNAPFAVAEDILKKFTAEKQQGRAPMVSRARPQ